VEIGDDERRRIERDLHDGAQQRLLAIAFDLRLARGTAERAGRSAEAEQLAAAERRALAAVDELRRLCRGIHPQILSQSGLGAALASLADGSAIPLEVEAANIGRAPASVENAAYELVLEALGQAARRGAIALDVQVARQADWLTVIAFDQGPEPLDVPMRLRDRIGATGGELLTAVEDGRAFIRADLPCPVVPSG
jgi:signal transduction histidine kinase